MIKKTRNLEPGDEVFINGKRSIIEMISRGHPIIKVRHSLGEGFFRTDAEWLVSEPFDVVQRAEEIVAENVSLT